MISLMWNHHTYKNEDLNGIYQGQGVGQMGRH